jgi:hypothetical protein
LKNQQTMMRGRGKTTGSEKQRTLNARENQKVAAKLRQGRLRRSCKTKLLLRKRRENGQDCIHNLETKKIENLLKKITFATFSSPPGMANSKPFKHT